MKKIVTCTSVSIYAGALTRGYRYPVLEEAPEKQQIKVKGDNHRIRWYPSHCFDPEGRDAPTLVSWQFDTPVEDEQDDNAEVSFTLSDGLQRWSLFFTPVHLQRLFDLPYSSPGIWGPHVVLVKRLSTQTVGAMLKYLDDHGNLIAASIPLDEGRDDD